MRSYMNEHDEHPLFNNKEYSRQDHRAMCFGAASAFVLIGAFISASSVIAGIVCFAVSVGCIAKGIVYYRRTR